MSKKLFENLPGDAAKVLKARKLNLLPQNTAKKKKYSQSLIVHQGHDILQHMIYVRRFLMERYQISYETLEVIWHMAPLNYFTAKDYVERIPPVRSIFLKHLVAKGLMKEVTVAVGKTKKLYRLSKEARHINTLTYEYLSGEKPIPECYNHNPLRKMSKVDAVAKTTFNAIKQLNQTPVPDTKKQLFS